MNRAIPMLIIGLIFGGLAGFLLAAANGVTLDGHDHATDHDTAVHDMPAGVMHAHSEKIAVTAEYAPTVAATLHSDPAGGWNLEVTTQNFHFAPEHVSQAHQDGEGHAHVSVNGVKVARIYSNWMQLTNVVSGDVVSVALFSNDHKQLAVNGQAISAQVTIP